MRVSYVMFYHVVVRVLQVNITSHDIDLILLLDFWKFVDTFQEFTEWPPANNFESRKGTLLFLQEFY